MPYAVDPSAIVAQAVAAAQAIVPTPASAPPSAEAVGGAAGTTTNSYALANHSHPRITRAATFVVAAGGVLSGTWAVSTLSPPIIIYTPIATGASRITCESTSAPTTTGFAGRCWADQQVTVNGTTIVGGLNVGPAVAPAGTQVQVVAIPASQ